MRKGGTLIIGLVGLPGAGKTTAARYLEKKGFLHVTLSSFIKEEASKRGIQNPTREILQDLGNELRKQYGPQILVQLALKKIKESQTKGIVIDGIRNLYEVAFLTVENNFVLIGVTASPRVRYERLLGHKGRSWTGTFDEFFSQERREHRLGSRQTGLRVKDCLKKANFVLRNESGLRDLEESLDAIIKTATMR